MKKDYNWWVVFVENVKGGWFRKGKLIVHNSIGCKTKPTDLEKEQIIEMSKKEGILKLKVIDKCEVICLDNSEFNIFMNMVKETEV